MGSIMYSPNAMTPTDCRKEKKSGEQQLKSDKSTSFYEVTNTEDIDTVIAGKTAKASVFVLLINISKLHENKCGWLTNYCATVTLQKKTTFGLKTHPDLAWFPHPFCSHKADSDIWNVMWVDNPHMPKWFASYTHMRDSNKQETLYTT